jgi:phosphatidylserine/phosphatidylglycerophosphate/cardiolipin synthase-like enzyme
MDSDIDFFRQAEEYSTETISLRDSVGTQSVLLLSSWGQLATQFALTPPAVQFYIHAKVLSRDQKDVIVSSFNLDPRSYNTNLEAVVEIHDCSELADDVEKGFAELQKAHADDIALGKVPLKESYSPLAIMFADTNLEQF